MSADIAGAYFAPGRSVRVAACLRGPSDALRVESDGGAMLAGPASVDELEISSRIGNTPRFVRFAGGGTFETADNAAVDALLARARRRHGLAHRLESRLRYVALGLVVTVAFVWGAARYGIPVLAEVAAHAMPAELVVRLGDGVLDMLDEHFLEPSTLPADEQARLRARFAPFVAAAGGGVPIQVEFRDAEKTLGPNALALPSGVVVFTDQLVKLAAADDELIAVLAHEIGHIEHRHALRHAIQGSTLGLAVTVLTGDIASVSSMIAAIPVILTELGYSRDFEFEADRHAALVLQRNGLEPAALARALARLERSHGGERCAEHAGAAAETGGGSGGGDCHGEAWWRYLSTHPPTTERIRRLDAIAAESGAPAQARSR